MKEKLDALLITDGGIEVSGKVNAENVIGLPALLAEKINTIKDADKIIVLDDGKMVGMGKHQDLIKNNKVYNCSRLNGIICSASHH